MVAATPDPSYVMAVYEMPPPPGPANPSQVTRLGVAAADVASGLVLLGEFLDDE
ncbi:hypothetical protein HaLaN_01454, partial [Haematococcus lacustris]